MSTGESMMTDIYIIQDAALRVTRLTLVSTMSLPVPGSNQAYCDVSALEAGILELRHDMFISNPKPDATSLSPSLSFLLTHSNKPNTRFLFDLGIRRDWENLSPECINRIKEWFPLQVPQDVTESLAKGGISPSDITTICLSHLHWDHIGNTNLFPNATFHIGADGVALLQNAYPDDPKAVFSSDAVPSDRIAPLTPSEWSPLGPFPHALDFYKDGSLYIIDAPGHLPGHLNILARTSADGAWIYLAADSAHHWNLITGESDIAVGFMGHQHACAHTDKVVAEETIKRIKEVYKIPRVKVVLAHDVPWYEENKGGPVFWPGKIASL